jgi:hypothetical protein
MQMEIRVVKKILLGGLLLLAGSGVFATEGGGSAYPHGAEGFMAGALQQLRMVGAQGHALFMMDRELGNRPAPSMPAAE